MSPCLQFCHNMIITFFKMSDVFDTCEGNFLKNIRFVQRALQQGKTGPKQEEISEAISEAAQELNRMEIESGMCQQPEMKIKIGTYKEELRSYKRKVTERQKQVKEQQLSDETFQKEEEVGANPLLAAKRQMYEAEAMSGQAVLGIKKNNEVLMKNITRMGDINNQLTIAQKLLGSIKKKMTKNKYTLWGTLLLLAAVVIFVIYTYLA